MSDDVKTAHASSAYAYPLLIKQLLHTSFAQAREQEIVYRGQVRIDYATLRERIARLANGLSQLGVEYGSTVAVMDWDSHRYLESYFAIPMMGAVLQTVNVRLSPEQLLYTIAHAEDKVILVHKDFLPLIKAVKGRITTVDSYVLLTDDKDDEWAAGEEQAEADQLPIKS